MKRLSVKFLLAFLCFGFLSFWMIALLGSTIYRRAAVRDRAAALYDEARQIASYQIASYGTSRPYDLTSLSVYTSVSGTRVLILSADRTVVYDSRGRAGAAGRTLSGFNPAESENYYRIGRFDGLFSEDTLSVFTPVTAGMELTGYVTLHRPMSEVKSLADSMLSRSYMIFGLIFLLSLLMMLFVLFTVLRPLHAVTKGVQVFSAGQLDYRIPVNTADEIGYLAGALNAMAGDLQSANDYQKKFISNVSHDFRSPLTSIRGYVQAMQDGVIPPESQGKYLQIILDETDRLSKLTQNTLSLDSLDEKKMKLNLTDFDLVSLIKKTCLTFEGSCKKRGISFDLIFPGKDVYVTADMSRIQQVLYNLIDNAVKFSRDGEPICIEVYPVGGKAAVSVKDRGCGIAKEDLGKIWNRFYKADSSRGRDKKGTGLGLAIVKEAIAAHGETIDVASTLGSGTEFIFRLPLVSTEEEE